MRSGTPLTGLATRHLSAMMMGNTNMKTRIGHTKSSRPVGWRTANLRKRYERTVQRSNPMTEINLKQKYKFSNPSSYIKGAHEETTATAEQIINHMKSLNDDKYKDATDLQLLDEFIVIHWAEKIGESND